MGEGGGSRICKEGIREIWGKNEHRSKEVREVRYSRRKRL